MSEITVNGLSINYDAENLLPEHMRGCMRRYIEERRQPGSFLTSVLASDLMQAAAVADDINRQRLFDYANWLHNYAPPECYGSYNKVDAWLRGPEK